MPATLFPCADIRSFPNGIARETTGYESAQVGAGASGNASSVTIMSFHSDMEVTHTTTNPAPNNSNRTASLAPTPLRLTVMWSDKAQSPIPIASGCLLPHWQWANGHRVPRSRSPSNLAGAA